MVDPTLELQHIDQSKYKEMLFDERPQADVYYPGPAYKRLETTIAADIRGHASLIVLTGEAGTGKTPRYSSYKKN